MDTNNNRIKVADLEINQSNKVLTTNNKGELEFSDINNLKSTSYNDLDYTSEGKTLDARQGKVLKDLIDNVNIPLATDAETQIITAFTEDKKVISRLKLLNWWTWIKSQAQTISANWTFNSNLYFGTAGYITSNTFALFLRARAGKQIQIGIDGIMTALIVVDSNGVEISKTATFPAGTTTKPPILLPSGVLTIDPQNGAIERDSNGILWETHNNTRSKLLTSVDDVAINSNVLHKTTDETFTGLKSAINTGTTQINGINLTNNGTTTSARSLNIDNTNSGIGARISNTGINGIGINISTTGAGSNAIRIANSDTGTGIYTDNQSTGVGIVLNSNTASTGDLLRFQKNGILTTKFDQNGKFIATNKGDSQTTGIDVINTSTNTGSQVINITNQDAGLGARVTNNGTGIGLYANNLGATGIGIQLRNATGTGARLENDSTGHGIVLNSATDSTGDLMQFRKNNIVKSKIDQNGVPNVPKIIIPTNTLTTVQENAIERDGNGKLWTTRGGVRYMLTEDDGSYVKILINGPQMIIDTPAPYITTNNTRDTILGTLAEGSLSNSLLARLTMIGSAGDVKSGGGDIAPTSIKFQIVIKFTNATLSSDYYTPRSTNEVVLLDNLNMSGLTTFLMGTRAGWDATWGLFNGQYIWSADGTTAKNLNTVSAQIICRRIVQFADATNANGNNQAIRTYTAITSTLIERIRP